MNVTNVEEFLLAERTRTISRIRRMIGDSAEDVYQEACLRAWLYWESWDGRASRATWFYAISQNLALAHVRARLARPEGQTVPDCQPIFATLGEGSEARLVRILDVRRAIGRLPKGYREEARLQMIGISTANQPSTRKVRWMRAKEFLRASLEGKRGSDDRTQESL
jgi:DNA-directed RNA polymerase specialized sigma24 family protein